ncbi:MAG: class SAM-dependent methyltransferase [Pseudonocardiales bacterium]|nr:class SAM-dependent methyltransferase [Pseudonocardiales bacterium]
MTNPPADPAPAGQAPAEGRPNWAGRELLLEVGAVAHGGHCVARYEGRVVFVRHTLPGETVRAVVTEDGGAGFCRADAVEILTASPDRVAPPCPHAGPARCGGCDWQHASGPAQRRLKAAVIAEALTRLGGLAPEQAAVTVEELPVDGPNPLLGWRTRTVYARTSDGRIGFHRHRGSSIEIIGHCPIATAPVGSPSAVARAAQAADRPGATGIEVVGPDAVLLHTPAPASARRGRGRRPPDRVQLIEGPASIEHVVLGRTFRVRPDGFWQVHPAAAATFVEAALAMLDPQPGETALDLYAGAGLFTAFLGDRVGPTGAVLGLESSRGAVADAEANLGDLPHAQVQVGSVDPQSVTRLAADAGRAIDVVVLDPPRSGAGGPVMAAVLGLAPRAVAYIACDPAAFARDVRTAADLGWRLAGLRAFDAFPMTQHMECVGLLLPAVAP